MPEIKAVAITADLKEVSVFSDRSSIWWDESKNILHSMNKLRVELIEEGLIRTGFINENLADGAKPLKGLQILDVGCGGGILSEALANLGATVVGIDLSLEMIQVAKDHASLNPSLINNINYICGSIEEHVKQNYEKYDAVVASEVIEHVNEPEVFLDICTQCLKPAGSIFITTFNKTWASWLGGIIFAEYITGIIPRGTHSWDKFISPETVQKMLEKYNCLTQFISGTIYNIFTDTWHWRKSSSITYSMQAVKQKPLM